MLSHISHLATSTAHQSNKKLGKSRPKAPDKNKPTNTTKVPKQRDNKPQSNSHKFSEAGSGSQRTNKDEGSFSRRRPERAPGMRSNEPLPHQKAKAVIRKLRIARCLQGNFSSSFFLPVPVAFRRVCGLEAYSRTSRE